MIVSTVLDRTHQERGIAAARAYHAALAPEREAMWAERAAIVRRAFAAGKSGRQLAAEVGWARGTVASVVQWMRRRGELVTTYAKPQPKPKRSRGRGIRRPWTDAERNFLTRHYGRRPVAWLAQRLGRTVDACHQAAYKNRAGYKDNTDLTLRDAAAALGVSPGRVAHWIASGLPASHGHGNGGRVWSISEHALDAFLRERPWLVPPDDLKPGYWRDLLEHGVAAGGWVTVTEAGRRLGYDSTVLAVWVREQRIEGHRRSLKGGGFEWVVRWHDAEAEAPRHAARVHARRSESSTRANLARWARARGDA